MAASVLYDHYNKSAQAACTSEHYHVTGTAPRPPTASPLTAHAAPRGQFVSAGESAAGSLLPSSWSRPLTVTCCTDAPTAPCRPSAGGRGERPPFGGHSLSREPADDAPTAGSSTALEVSSHSRSPGRNSQPAFPVKDGCEKKPGCAGQPERLSSSPLALKLARHLNHLPSYERRLTGHQTVHGRKRTVHPN